MKSYKDFFLISDMDGTLANSKHVVSEKNKAAIDHFIKQGGKFAIATGRTQNNVGPYMQDLTVNAPCIFYNGGALFDWNKQELIKTVPVQGENLVQFIRHCIQLFPNMCIEIFTAEELYIVTDPKNVDEHMVREKQAFVYANLDEILGEEWIKIILCDQNEKLLTVNELLDDFQLDKSINYFFSAPIYLELVGKSISKGSMLGEVLKMEEYKDKIVVAAGDFQNDIEMIKLAHLGVAPANAQPDVKKAANMIGVSNDEDLLDDIIYRLMPTLF
jgi:Cof subfamily protein (haloacid dehalogenase superfamily)